MPGNESFHELMEQLELSMRQAGHWAKAKGGEGRVGGEGAEGRGRGRGGVWGGGQGRAGWVWGRDLKTSRTRPPVQF